MSVHNKQISSGEEANKLGKFSSRLKSKSYEYYHKAYQKATKYIQCITLQLIKDLTLATVPIIALYLTTKQIDISEQSMKVSNRPYLVLNKIDFENNFFVDNYGKTPSFNTKIYYTGQPDTGDVFIPTGVYTDSIITHSTIGTVLHTFIPLEKERRLKKWLRSDSVFCEGEIIYSDVFGDWHGYKFCFKGSYGSWTKYKNYNYPFEIKK